MNYPSVFLPLYIDYNDT